LRARRCNKLAWFDKSRGEALMRSLISTHTILGVRPGEFVSLLDPPEAFREAAAGCRNIGTWPALVWEEGERDGLLSSPVIAHEFEVSRPNILGFTRSDNYILRL
jgi:hydrogenase maturation protease